MATIHQRSEAELIENILSDAEGIPVYADILRKLQKHEYQQSWVDVFFQKWEKFGKLNLADAYVFGHLWAAIRTGAIAYTKLGIGAYPLPDKDIEGNDRILKTRLRELDTWKDLDTGQKFPSCKFSGAFWGGTQDEDGHISWDGAAIFEFHRNGEKIGNYISKNEGAPLEVGYTSATKTFFQLVQYRRLARWPYDSNDITVMHVIDPKYFKVCLI